MLCTQASPSFYNKSLQRLLEDQRVSKAAGFPAAFIDRFSGTTRLPGRKKGSLFK
jgi:hypothetical protein